MPLLPELALLLCPACRHWWTDTKVCTLTGAACTCPGPLTSSGALPAPQDACHVVVPAINVMLLQLLQIVLLPEEACLKVCSHDNPKVDQR